MALVRSNDEFTRCEFFVESSYGVPGTYPTGYVRFPFAGEDLHIEQETIPPSEEFTAFGGISSVDIGKRLVRGTLTLEPSYEAIWFWQLFGNAFSYENKVGDLNPLCVDVTDPLTTNLHVFNTGPVLKSFTINVWKGGVGPADASHYAEIYTGCKIQSWTWEQPQNGRAKVTLTFVGAAMGTTTLDLLGTPPSQEATYLKFRSTDLLSSRPAGKILFGASDAVTPTQMNLTAFTITCDKKVDDTAPPFLPSVTTGNEPSIEGNREITLNITSNLETDYNAAKKPFKQWATIASSSVIIIYDSGTSLTTAPAGNYAFRVDFPRIKWTEMRDNITGPGVVTLTGTGMCELASTANLGSTYDDITGMTAKTIDMRMMTHVAFTDEPTSDSKYTGLADQP